MVFNVLLLPVSEPEGSADAQRHGFRNLRGVLERFRYRLSRGAGALWRAGRHGHIHPRQCLDWSGAVLADCHGSLHHRSGLRQARQSEPWARRGSERGCVAVDQQHRLGGSTQSRDHHDLGGSRCQGPASAHLGRFGRRGTNRVCPPDLELAQSRCQSLCDVCFVPHWNLAEQNPSRIGPGAPCCDEGSGVRLHDLPLCRQAH
mmetsp:Transcript_41878/g.135503  ORF Transcript_41878/g.135503 Transcript_41878/m.135503 type:complete len:203 (-) Transcript_41878:1440-2048(-)